MATSVNSVCAAPWWTSIRHAQQSQQPRSHDPASVTERHTGVLTAADEFIGHKSLQTARYRLRAADPVVAQLIDECPVDQHVFQTFSAILDEGAAALDRAGQFLTVHLAAAELV